MRHLNKLASAFCAAALGLLMLTGCEGSELYTVGAPDWLSDKIDSIQEANKPVEENLEGMQEDVYSFGKTDFSSGWWQEFSKYYRIGEGEKWNGVFNLHINPSENTLYYQNFALILTNDTYENRNGDGYVEYGAIRFDNAGLNFNSEWGDHIDRSLISGNMMLMPVDNIDANVQKLGGKIIVTVDRSRPDSFVVKMTNGTVQKQYVQPYKLENFNSNPANDTIRCFIVADGSYMDFLESNIEPIGGFTSAEDKQPLSMTLYNTPTQMYVGDDLQKLTAGVTAEVIFEGNQKKTVTAADLTFSVAPDANTGGEKTLIAVYNKTYKGENADKPVMAQAKITVKDGIKSIRVVQKPSQTHYENVFEGYPFIPAGMVVEGIGTDGSVSTLSYDRLIMPAIPAQTGTHTLTISTESGATATVDITVGSVIASTYVHPKPTIVGAEDNSSGFFTAHLENDIQIASGQTVSASFTNYSSMGGNWNNFLIVLRSADKATEYVVARADNWGWGLGYGACTPSGGQANWDAWRVAMDGAKVGVCVTNVGDGTANVRCVMVGNDGNAYYQDYIGINSIVPDNCYLDFTVDLCHLVFD